MTKKVISKLIGKIVGKAGGFVIGYLMDIPGVGSEAKVNMITEPAPTIMGDINIEKNHQLNMNIELYTGDRAGSFVIKAYKTELDKTQALLNELRYRCINEAFSTYRFEDINIQFQEEGTYLIQVFFPESELRNQYRINNKNDININAEGVGQNNNVNIITNSSSNDKTGFVSDIDGNTYSTIKIGGQWWMSENLAYLPSVSPSSSGSSNAPYYYVYDYEGSSVSAARATRNYRTYGVLYNWPAATQACPSGWHLPSDAEWKELTDYLGGEKIAYGKLKETGFTHWKSPNTGATNSSGFKALPGGNRFKFGAFVNIGLGGNWWSVTEKDAAHAWGRDIINDYENVLRNDVFKECGSSVRCVKD